MTNLFSAFDPSALGGLNLKWVSSVLFLFFMPGSIFLTVSRSSNFWKQLLKLLNKEYESVLGKYATPGSTWFILSLFLFIFVNNILGLFPYIFTSTSHMSFALAMAFPLWSGHLMYSWVRQPEFMLAHLVPLGTPPALMAFMVLIELVSNLIRPLTLSVRLMANLTAGHLLLCLLSSNMTLELLSLSSLGVLVGLTVMMVLEIAVSLIQAYVFTLLSSLYLEEVQTKTVSF